MTVKESIEYARENGAMVVDFRFTDLFGAWQHFSTEQTARLTKGAAIRSRTETARNREFAGGAYPPKSKVL